MRRAAGHRPRHGTQVDRICRCRGALASDHAAESARFGARRIRRYARVAQAALAAQMNPSCAAQPGSVGEPVRVVAQLAADSGVEDWIQAGRAGWPPVVGVGEHR